MRYLLLLALLIPLLQGCFPIVAAGVGAGVLVAEDRRTSGTVVEDKGIEIKIGGRVGEKYKDQIHLNTASYNRNVLLTGEVQSNIIKADIEQIAREVPNVRSITNELTVGPTTSLSSRGNDSFITSKVKARFLDAHKFQINYVKVITENSVVYLLGLVTQKEADDAKDIASTTQGVSKVVAVFEYIK